MKIKKGDLVITENGIERVALSDETRAGLVLVRAHDSPRCVYVKARKI